MSWQFASFAVLGAVLLAGFAWYEHSRPPSQIVALVAALAALAVAGRLALAPVPNVVATTDVVIFAGYAIGAAPGFTVGALAGVVSNFWLGQGPWTPWQMAAWGLAGIFGALLCRLTRGNPNRFVLAAACGLAGIAFGAIMNFSLMASYGGELSWERFLALEARAVPFDVAHAIGNVTLALIAGPAMVRMLVRFRERFEWRRSDDGGEAARPRPGRGAAVAGATLVALVLLVAPAQGADLGAAANWLQSNQNSDGGFGGTPGENSSVAMTGWAMLGLEADGRNPLDILQGAKSPVSYLRANVGSISTTGDLARTTLALAAAGVDVRGFQGHNLLTELRGREAKNGSFQGWPNSTAFAILALRAGNSPDGLENALSWLRSVQNDNGGWGDVARSPSNADTTGAVLQAVHGSSSAHAAVRYLRGAQVDGGGFRLGDSGAVNSQSTAWAVQGMTAAGLDPSSVTEGGRSALDYLDARQADDGHFRYSKTSDVTPIWVTGQVLVAAAGKSFPLTVVPRVDNQLGAAQAQGTDATGSTSSSGTLPDHTSPIPSTSGGSGKGGSKGKDKNGSGSPGVGPLAPVAGQDGVAGTESSGGKADGGAVAPAAAPSPTADDGPSPVASVGIGLATGSAALFGTWFLGRRRVW